MSELNELKELYLALGVGGLSFVVIIVVLLFILKYILPVLQEIKQVNAVTQSFIQNSAKALEEVSKSNQNVANALTILDKSMNSVHSDVKLVYTEVKTVQETNDNIEKQLLVMNEKLKRGGI